MVICLVYIRGIISKYEGVYILKGCEINIIDENGTVDISWEALDTLEWVIASLYITKPFDFDTHTNIRTNIAQNPHIDVIGHCGEEKFAFDYEKVIPLFAEYGKVVEINASSFRTRPTCKDKCMKIAHLCAKLNADAYRFAEYLTKKQADNLIYKKETCRFTPFVF